MKDFLEIGYWRQRDSRVERVIAAAEELLGEPAAGAEDLERRLAAAIGALRSFDAESCPWRRQPAPAR